MTNIEVLMQDGCTKAEAENHLKRGTVVYEESDKDYFIEESVSQGFTEKETIQKEIYSIRWRTSCTKGTWKPRKNAKTTATIIRTQKDGNQSPALFSLFSRSTTAVYSFGYMARIASMCSSMTDISASTGTL